MLKGVVNKIKNSFYSGISKASNFFTDGLSLIFKGFKGKKKIDECILLELRNLLLSASVSAKTSDKIIEMMRKECFDIEMSFENFKIVLVNKIVEILGEADGNFLIDTQKKPTIILMCGTNGNGKTTTIAKLAHLFSNIAGKKVLVSACDTFRVAAKEQLENWSKKINVECFCGNANEDPASVAFKSLQLAIDKQYEVLIIDTAGRLHTENNLMSELEKIVKVIEKKIDKQIDYKIMCIDATIGNNAMKQINSYYRKIGINGVIITKLDGTAKAGFVISFADENPNIKIYGIGCGEKVDDFSEFNSLNFAEKLVGIDDSKYSQ